MKSMRISVTWLAVILLSLPLFGFTSAPPTGGDAAWSQQQQALTVNFQWLGTVPVELHHPVHAALDRNRALLPTIDRWTVSTFRQTGDWAKAVLVPTHVVEAGWGTTLKSDEILEVIAHLEGNVWAAYLEDEPAFSAVKQSVPRKLKDYTSTITPKSHALRFPWTSGNLWEKSNGWHQEGSAIDFRPVDPNDVAVLASGGGNVTLVCADPFQAMFRVEHHDGERTGYLHLDVNTIKTNIDGQNIPRGWYLGDIYDGNATTANNCPSGLDCQYDTPCGYGTGPHIHFTITDQNAAIDGNNIDDVASAPNGTPFLSTNARIDPCGPPSSGTWTIQDSCIFCDNASAPGNVVVENGAILTVFPEANLNIDLANYHLLIRDGAGVQIADGGRIH